MMVWRRHISTMHAFDDGARLSLCNSVTLGLTDKRSSPNFCRVCRIKAHNASDTSTEAFLVCNVIKFRPRGVA